MPVMREFAMSALVGEGRKNSQHCEKNTQRNEEKPMQPTHTIRSQNTNARNNDNKKLNLPRTTLAKQVTCIVVSSR